MTDQSFNAPLAEVDPEIAAVLDAELQRQRGYLEMIASENFAPLSVIEAQGSVLTNKYAEGYPGRRYYGGCEYVDVVEQLAIDRVKQLFGSQAANVQPHCGASANEAVFLAFLKPGDTIMGMSLAEGGHLTHGMPLNISGKWFNVVSYGLNAQEAIDYDAMEKKAHETKPKLIIAAKAIAFKEALQPEFKQYAQQVKKNAQVVAETLTQRGLRIVSGGTESHVMLVDLRAKGITGKEAEAVLGRAHMTINKNAIPNDPEKPMVTSGVRIGTPAMTTRGFGETEARATANLVADVLDNPGVEANLNTVRAKVAELTKRFPVYGG